MKMTFEQYMKDPLGTHSPLFTPSIREGIRKDYSARFDAILVRENGKIVYQWYYDKKGNVYYCHIKIPSETVRRFYYDVVIKFSASADVKEVGQNLELYNVQFFSNDPAFVFTYANAFLANDMFVRDLLPKMSRQAVKKPAKEKNPQGFTGYVKTIYFAYLFLKMKGMLNTAAIKGGIRPYNKNDLLKVVQDADTTIKKRQIEGEKQQKQKVKNNRVDNRNVTGDHVISHVPSVGSIGKIPSVPKNGSANNMRKPNITKVNSVGSINKH